MLRAYLRYKGALLWEIDATSGIIQFKTPLQITVPGLIIYIRTHEDLQSLCRTDRLTLLRYHT